MRIRVKVCEDAMGNLLLSPVRADIRRRIYRHLSDIRKLISEHLPEMHNRPHPNNYGTAVLQGDELDAYLETLTPYARRMLERGYGVTLTVDAWSFAHLYGWNTHTLFE